MKVSSRLRWRLEMTDDKDAFDALLSRFCRLDLRQQSQATRRVTS
ncbi:hypothetical protein Agau_L300454 [Agrobacterium tumefaciens F2]|nr:hypothetical protein Agau_L300454 [Agrobacterium tumefaciens F2]